MPKILKLIALTLMICQSAPTVMAADSMKPKEGALAVETADNLSLNDAARKKDLPYKVYYPKTGGPYPVIVFSHGFGGNKDAFALIAKHWASHGYVVIHPSHADGLGRQKSAQAKDGEDPGAPRARLGLLKGGMGGGLMSGLNDPEKISGRVADLVLIMDSLGQLPKSTPGLAGKIDAQRIGVGGHSFGAYTAMLIGGVTADLGNEKSKSFCDPRVKCILPISAQGTGQQGLTEKSWTALKQPMMTITGTRDQGVGGQGVDWKKEPYKYSPAGNKYLVVIDGANHLSFGGGLGSRGGDITDTVKLCTTYYWDAYLKDSEPAKKYLQSDKLPKDAGNCTLEKK